MDLRQDQVAQPIYQNAQIYRKKGNSTYNPHNQSN